jgi:2-methylisocitrate lyase-like PEP mutase family enzyme
MVTNETIAQARTLRALHERSVLVLPNAWDPASAALVARAGAAAVATTGAYAEAGADCLFVPGLLDRETLRRLTAASPLPVNAMTGPGGPTVAELTACGVRRITVGTALAQAAYAVADRAARELLTTGTCTALDPNIAYPDLNALVT